MATAHNPGLVANSDDLDVDAQPGRVTAGGIVVVTALPDVNGTYTVTWTVEGPVRLSDNDTRIALLGSATIDGEPMILADDRSTPIRATLDTGQLAVGSWRVGITLTRVDDDDGEAAGDSTDSNSNEPAIRTGMSGPIQVMPRPFAAGDDVGVTLKRAAVPPTDDQALWVAIRKSTEALGFDNYSRFIEAVMCDHPDHAFGRREQKRIDQKLRKVKSRTALPFPNVDRYRLLKATTEVFLMTHCGVDLGDFSNVDLGDESRRLNRTVEPGDLEDQMRDYLTRVALGHGEYLEVLPYLGLIRRQLGDVSVVGNGQGDRDDSAEICYGILSEKLTNPCFLELLHEYWYEECGLMQTLNAISWRFQNRTSSGRGPDPLANLDVDPLRPLNNLLWGVVQDQQHRLTTVRRAYEYDHQYGLVLASKPGPPVRGADSRSRFIEAFHNLLALCATFYVQDDNTTVIADGFGVLNALKETHLLLTEGSHNQYGDLPWQARHEVLMYQWILSRQEMREFLSSRTMVVYPEPWIAPVEAMNKLRGWSDTPVLHFRDLAVFGEQLLLGIRFGAWTTVHEPDRAANWARYFRPEVQAYIHAYRAVTGVDLTKRTDRAMPAYHLRHRVAQGGYRG